MSRELKRLQAFNAVAPPKPKLPVRPPSPPPPPSHVSCSKETSPSKASSDDDDDEITLGQVASASTGNSLSSSKISSPKHESSSNTAASSRKANAKKRKLPTPSPQPPQAVAHGTQKPVSSAEDPVLASVVTTGVLPSDPQLGWRIEVMVPRLGEVWWEATVTGWHGGRHECWFDVGVASYQDLRPPEAGGNSDGSQWRRSSRKGTSRGEKDTDEEDDQGVEEDVEANLGTEGKTGKGAASSSSSSSSSSNDLDLSHAPWQWQRALKRDGYLVVKGVLPRSQCSSYLDGMWDFVRSLNPQIDRKHPDTWYPPLDEKEPELGAYTQEGATTAEKAGELARYTEEVVSSTDDAKSSPTMTTTSGGGGGKKSGSGGGWDEDPWPESGRGLFQEHGAGWAPFSIALREQVAFVFERLYGTSELHTSKDGFTFLRPPRSADEVSKGDWSHFDQDGRPGNFGLRCVQGSISLLDQDPEDGCFQCWPGSHAVHPQIMALNGIGSTGNYYELGDDDKALLVQRGCNAYRIEVSAGDLVLWRSDLAHSNAQPLYSKRVHKQRFRAVAYVCMLPASHTKEAAYKKKAEGWRLRKTTSHWPNLETWFRERPRERERVAAFTATALEVSDGHIEGNISSSSSSSSSSIPPRPPPDLRTLRQRQLHGLERYPGSSSGEPASKAKSKQKRRKKVASGSNITGNGSISNGAVSFN